jgi:hypothetical protein
VAAGAGGRREAGAGLQGRRRGPLQANPVQIAELEAVLDAGPAARGWQDQCWTLARIGELVRERFGVDYTSRPDQT